MNPTQSTRTAETHSSTHALERSARSGQFKTTRCSAVLTLLSLVLRLVPNQNPQNPCHAQARRLATLGLNAAAQTNQNQKINSVPQLECTAALVKSGVSGIKSWSLQLPARTLATAKLQILVNVLSKTLPVSRVTKRHAASTTTAPKHKSAATTDVARLVWMLATAVLRPSVCLGKKLCSNPEESAVEEPTSAKMTPQAQAVPQLPLNSVLACPMMETVASAHNLALFTRETTPLTAL